MGSYAEKKNYKPHNIKRTTVTLNEAHIVEGLHTFEAEMDEDNTSIFASDDGTALFVENPKRIGTIRLVFLEATATTDYLNDLFDAGEPFKITAQDEVAENLNVTGWVRAKRRPAVKRMGQPDMPEWILTGPYVDIKGGSYALATV